MSVNVQVKYGSVHAKNNLSKFMEYTKLLLSDTQNGLGKLLTSTGKGYEFSLRVEDDKEIELYANLYNNPAHSKLVISFCLKPA